MATVLVTGGAGFVGAHTSSRLLRDGHDVWILDYFHRYIHPIPLSFIENTTYRLEVLIDGAEIVYGSTSYKDDLRRHLARIRPDYVVHLAALPLANRALKQSQEALDSIVLGTVNLLEVLRDMPPIENFVYVSSSMVYGDFTQQPMPESAPTNPKEIYGGMKLAGETLVRVFSQRYDIPACIIRPSAIYGPTDNNFRVLQVFVERAVRREVLTAVNPETTALDFTFVEDVADGICRALFSKHGEVEVFNITRGEQHTLTEALEILANHFPDLRVEWTIEGNDFRPNRGALDISKARQMLGFDPVHSLETGLPLYIDHVKRYNPSLRPASALML